MAELSAKRVGYALIAFGALAALVAVLADPLGIGGEEGFGWKQGFLLSVGVNLAIGGVGVMRGWFAGLGPRRGDPPRRAAADHRAPARPEAIKPHDVDHEASRHRSRRWPIE
ncbi:MAG TPA: hypothetical protein VHT50_10875 [Mycobacterium sp.]|nr:hypothetical protein [Mycobacterium sp.]